MIDRYKTVIANFLIALILGCGVVLYLSQETSYLNGRFQ